ncbi:MAG: hypothetical protein ABFR63_11765, partial [Thermodesulfobacteriota bacterium]
RLIRGEVVDVLGPLCTELGAELLILGPSRKKEGILRSASVRRRLENQGPCPLRIAEGQQFSPATDLAALQPEELTAGQLLASDIFLVDLWYEQLHFHTDFIYQLLLHPEQDPDPAKKQCPLGQFLASLERSGNWEGIISILGPIQRSFQGTATEMLELPKHDHVRLQDIYMRESLPLSCSLKKELGRVSLLLRAHLESVPPSVPFLVDETCPVSQPDLACYGPLLGALNLDQDLCVLIQKSMVDT